MSNLLVSVHDVILVGASDSWRFKAFVFSNMKNQSIILFNLANFPITCKITVSNFCLRRSPATVGTRSPKQNFFKAACFRRIFNNFLFNFLEKPYTIFKVGQKNENNDRNKCFHQKFKTYLWLAHLTWQAFARRIR